MSLKDIIKPIIPVPLRRGLRDRQRRARLFWMRRFGPLACPVCEMRLDAFCPLPAFYAEEWKRHGFNVADHEAETLNETAYGCPHCGASDRERLYALFLHERLAGVPASFNLVDFAPNAPLRQWINRTFRIRYRTADLFNQDVDDRVDLTDLAIYPAASFDAFICSHVLEHIREDDKAMRELFRILKPGGWGILMVPICLRQREVFEDPTKATTESDRWRYFGQGDHVRIYGKQGFLDRVVSGGFRVKEFGREHFGDETFRRHGITLKSVLYVVEK